MICKKALKVGVQEDAQGGNSPYSALPPPPAPPAKAGLGKLNISPGHLFYFFQNFPKSYQNLMFRGYLQVL